MDNNWEVLVVHLWTKKIFTEKSLKIYKTYKWHDSHHRSIETQIQHIGRMCLLRSVNPLTRIQCHFAIITNLNQYLDRNFVFSSIWGAWTRCIDNVNFSAFLEIPDGLLTKSWRKKEIWHIEHICFRYVDNKIMTWRRTDTFPTVLYIVDIVSKLCSFDI